MRALIAMVLAALLAGCCVGGYPPMWSADQPPFSAFQAGMRLAVGMPTDVAILIIGSRPVSSKATSCGVAARGSSGHATFSNSAAARVISSLSILRRRLTAAAP